MNGTRFSYDNMVDTTTEFIQSWQPDDPKEAARFSAELLAIIRRVHSETSTPYIKHLTETVEQLANLGGQLDGIIAHKLQLALLEENRQKNDQGDGA